jgi:hypothetical protein
MNENDNDSENAEVQHLQPEVKGLEDIRKTYGEDYASDSPRVPYVQVAVVARGSKHTAAVRGRGRMC